jgi:predicted nucleic acid-binding protein
MIVVADTSPLNHLIRLGRPDASRNLWPRFSSASCFDRDAAPGSSPEVSAWAFAAPAWLEAMEVQQLDASLAEELGAGERQAISLALEVQADVLLIDERAGRREAEARHIEVVGALAVLLQASLRGYFDLPEAMKQLRQCGFRVSRPIEALMLARYEQANKTKP